MGVSGVFFFFKQKTAYEMRISDWSSDVCSSDLAQDFRALVGQHRRKGRVAEDLAQPAVDDGVQPRPGILLAADGLEEQQRVVDAVAREDVDDEPLLVGQDRQSVV